ncbi:hypothetical protein R3P38DRAFT_2797140 [Favolaschia claudopus]|uniref:Uncharacterized protein n=1 Tax=Favolaschia claudopus TaxID=2862362 RepID=A0AAW0A3B1_9AGAR
MALNIHSPILPPELEREIFELCALISLPRGILKLMLVAQRVHECSVYAQYREIDPELPRISPSALCSVMKRKPPGFFDTVRRVFLRPAHNEPPCYLQFLTLCINLEDVDIWFPFQRSPWISLVEQLHLRRLSIEPEVSWALSKTSPIFSNLTHLQFCSKLPYGSEPRMLSTLEAFQALTHFACIGIYKSLLTMSHRMLSSLTSLRILILWIMGSQYMDLEDFQDLAQDVRFIVMPRRRHIADGVDFWVEADIFSDKRRTGEIDVRIDLIALQRRILCYRSTSHYSGIVYLVFPIL